MGQLLRSTEIEQVLMISEYDNRVRVSFKVMTPFSERPNNSEQFSVKDLVVPFCQVQGLG
jgi:hypothetical protein